MVYLIIAEFWRKEGIVIDLFKQLEWSYWKTLNDLEKTRLFEQVQRYFIPSTLTITSVELVTFELCGIKCRTFEVEIDCELFVLVPGNPEAILGWDLGAEGLRYHELLSCDTHYLSNDAVAPCLTFNEQQALYKEIENEENSTMTSMEEIRTYINLHTSPLRKAAIPAMLVQKAALPVGTRFLGVLDTVTGTFTGDWARFFPYEDQIKQILCPTLTARESLIFIHPETYIETNQFYLEALPESDHYFVYSFQQATHAQLQGRLKKQGFTLLTQDQWEYAVGAGTRKLFRWGNDLFVKANESGRQLLGKMCGPNMFGLLFETTQSSYELTTRLTQCKLSYDKRHRGTLIEQQLPLSSYYCSGHQLSADQLLDPTTYSSRRAILIQP